MGGQGQALCDIDVDSVKEMSRTMLCFGRSWYVGRFRISGKVSRITVHWASNEGVVVQGCCTTVEPFVLIKLTEEALKPFPDCLQACHVAMDFDLCSLFRSSMW